ncbi:MAG: arsenate reductase ArsC [Spartobacteria bacterium]
MKEQVIFICIHNSARSQMAEAWLNKICGDRFTAQSAGLEPGKLNPIVVEAMAEEGIDISKKGTQSVSEVLQSGQRFACAITVCDETSAEKCPVFPEPTRRLHWGFPDPSVLTGTHAEKLAGVCRIRDQIRAKIEAWCEETCSAAETNE